LIFQVHRKIFFYLLRITKRIRVQKMNVQKCKTQIMVTTNARGIWIVEYRIGTGEGRRGRGLRGRGREGRDMAEV
jgi:hypothetical protein